MLPDSLKLYSSDLICRIVYENHESILAEFGMTIEEEQNQMGMMPLGEEQTNTLNAVIDKIPYLYNMRNDVMIYPDKKKFVDFFNKQECSKFHKLKLDLIIRNEFNII